MKASSTLRFSGAGLGLRRALARPLLDALPNSIDFLEVAPENWINLGGKMGSEFHQLMEHYPLACHGLSLSLGGPSPLDETFLHRVKRFLNDNNARIYSEHLSYCTDDSHLYDLLPIPFTEEAVNYVADRIKRTQDILNRRIAIENVSYYAKMPGELSEIEFINAVIEKADCDMLLDLNNIYVNSINHCYNPETFLKSMPYDKVRYFHIAGHYNEDSDLIIDTHAADVIDPVWSLLQSAYRLIGVLPTLLERDFNIPPLSELLLEVAQIHQYQSQSELTPIDTQDIRSMMLTEEAS